jgi:CHAD domain-containing protein
MMTKKSKKIPITNADIPLSECLNKITTSLLSNVLSFEKGARHGETDSIHDMRVATIKLHSVLKAFSPCFKKKTFKKNFLEIKKLLKNLGMARKTDVFMEILEKYYQNPKDIRPLTSRFTHIHLVAQKRLKSNLVKLKKINFKTKFYKFADSPLVFNSTFNIEMPLRESLENILPRTADEMIQNLKNAIKTPNLVDELHKTRIRAKPLKAISEISVSLFGNEFENCFREIKKVLSIMGEIHDLDETVIIIRKYHNKIWYKKLQNGLKSIKSHRSALFEKLREITENLEKTLFVKRIFHAIQYKTETKNGEIQQKSLNSEIFKCS